MTSSPYNNNLAGYYFLGIFIGVVISYSQLMSLWSVYDSQENIGLFVRPLMLFCAGIAIAVGSFLYMMKTRYGMWCIIPPEWDDSLHNKNESPLIKCIIILFIIQCLLSIPVVMYILNEVINDGNTYGIPLRAFALFVIWIILAQGGLTVFSRIHEKGKRDDE